MHPIWTLLRRISVSLLVRHSPHPSSGRLPPRLRRAPPWALGRALSAQAKQPAPERPTRAPEPCRWEGVGDPDYLLGEIVELREIARRSGLGTLARLLDRAAAETRVQVGLKQKHHGPRGSPQP